MRVRTFVKRNLWHLVSYDVFREWGGRVEAASASSADSKPTSLGAFLWPSPGGLAAPAQTPLWEVEVW